MEKFSVRSLFIDILRLIGVVLVFIFLAGLAQYAASLILKIPLTPEMGFDKIPLWQIIVFKTIEALVSLVVFFLFRRMFGLARRMIMPERPVTKRVISALCSSFLLIGVIAAFILVVNDISIRAGEQTNWPDVGFYLVLFVIGAFSEEVLGRAVFLEFLLNKHGEWTALIVSSLFFMALHIANPHLSVWAFANLFLAGILLGQTYILSGRNILWPVFFHAGWNFFQGAFWGFPVSGNAVKGSVFTLHFGAAGNPDVENFGLEASPVCTIFLIGSVVLAEFIKRHSRRGKVFRLHLFIHSDVPKLGDKLPEVENTPYNPQNP